MKIFSDFLALILFFATYWYTHDVRIATAVAVIIGVLQAAFTWYKSKKLETMQAVNLAIIVIFGGATIVLNNPIFVMWKPSILFWATASALIISQMMGKNGMKILMQKELNLPNNIWLQLNIAWMIFLTVMGIINLIVAYSFSFDFWISYKTFGGLGLMILFVLGQGIFISKHLPKEDN